MLQFEFNVRDDEPEAKVEQECVEERVPAETKDQECSDHGSSDYVSPTLVDLTPCFAECQEHDAKEQKRGRKRAWKLAK